MSLVVCKTCNKEISDEAMKCLHCGASTQRKKKYRKRIIISVLSIVISFILFFSGSVIYKNYVSNMQKQAKESRQEELYNTVVFNKYDDYETFNELQNLAQEYGLIYDFINPYISMTDESYADASIIVSEIAKDDRDGNELNFVNNDNTYCYIISDTSSESKLVWRIETESLYQGSANWRCASLCGLYISSISNDDDNVYRYGVISSCSYKGYSYLYFGLTKNT